MVAMTLAQKESSFRTACGLSTESICNTHKVHRTVLQTKEYEMRKGQSEFTEAALASKSTLCREGEVMMRL